MSELSKFCLEECDKSIITKRGEYTQHSKDGKKVYHDELDKTFWVSCSTCGDKKRFSTESAPKWILALYDKLVK